MTKLIINMFLICGELLIFINLLHLASGFDESFSSLSYYYSDYSDDWNDVDQGIGIAFSLLIGGFVCVILFTVFIAVCCVCYKQNQQLPTVGIHNGTHQTNISVIHPGQHSVLHSNPAAPHGVSYPNPAYGNHLVVTPSGPPAYTPFSFAPITPAYPIFHSGQSWQFWDSQMSGSGLSPSAPGLSAPSSSASSSPPDQQGNVGPPPVS
ncbi:uncharacterized protein LOC117123943 [Anneissia japonica]|uniref:uncharacterized protein LOC117123943 n=1 Tax=Anneissia japonica TaxID=1529436 RepID=UPI0014254FBF|nr:uncharacterized protein LOC117123943 [Anneissia japonica]